MSTSPFREEAAEHHRTRKVEGHVLRIAPGWTRHAYKLLLWSALAASAYVFFSRIHQYAPAAAVVRFGERVRLTAPVAGRIASTHVVRGQRVSAGAPMVRLDASNELATLARLEDERFAVTAQFLTKPTDQEARKRLGTIHAEIEQCRARIDNLTISAPWAGVVGALRVHAGQDAALGAETLVRGDSGAEVVAMVPADFRPYLHPGVAMRLEFEGLAYAYLQLRVESVGDEAIGPNEVRRYIGPDLADAIAINGPVVLVHASLPDPYIESAGQRYALHDGMLGKANLLVRRDRILFALIPGLRELWMESPR